MWEHKGQERPIAVTLCMVKYRVTDYISIQTDQSDPRPDGALVLLGLAAEPGGVFSLFSQRSPLPVPFVSSRRLSFHLSTSIDLSGLAVGDICRSLTVVANSSVQRFVGCLRWKAQPVKL